MRNFVKFFSATCIAAAGSLVMASCNNSTSAGAGNTQGDSTTAKEKKYAEAVISPTFSDTAVNGTIEFEQEDNGKVKMELQLTIPSKANKSVAVHIHEHGDCGDTGKNAHGHWNPTGSNHGKWGSGSFHSGDIGNVTLDSEGKGKMELETDLWSIGGDEKKNILNRSIIVHGGEDDYTSQPAGNSGTRIGCGLITEKKS